MNQHRGQRERRQVRYEPRTINEIAGLMAKAAGAGGPVELPPERERPTIDTTREPRPDQPDGPRYIGAILRGAWAWEVYLEDRRPTPGRVTQVRRLVKFSRPDFERRERRRRRGEVVGHE